MLIPDNIVDFQSIGEKLLYLKFRNDGSTKNYYVLHSLFTNYHLKNISGELDFLVLAPELGIFAIEVKHGRVWRSGGIWNFQKKDGSITTKKKSPFAQVDGTINSIRNYILNKLENNKIEQDRFSKILFGTGIAFTSMNEFVDFAPEGHSWQIFTRPSLQIPIVYYIDSLSKGWHNENKKKYFYDVNLSRPTNNDCKRIIQMLRGDFDIDYSEINRISDNETAIEAYTKEQFNLLDFVNYNNRCLIQGDAGTGKTIMAMELAHRSIVNKRRIAFFCFNNKLGKKLHESLKDFINTNDEFLYVGTLHSFLSRGTQLKFPDEIEKINNFYEEVLPIEFLIRNDESGDDEKYDLLIIDESQDLLTPNYLEVFDSILKGGIKNGNWVFFGDFSNQAIYLNDPHQALELLSSRTNFTKFPPLKINCRNTEKIARQNTLLTGIEMPEFTSRTLEGEEIVNMFPAKNRQLQCVEEVIISLEKKGIPLYHITLLSPKRLENTYLGEAANFQKRFSCGLSFHTIHSFKGLENTFIILFDFDEISSEEMQRLLYVGISRAKQKLYLILENNLQEEYQKLIAKNINKII